MSIANSCMLVNLRIGAWSGRRLDKAISREVVQQKHADEDALRVNKHLVPKETLAPSVTAANALRAHFYAKTLPWADQGARVITRVGYRPFLDEHERLVAAFNDTISQLVNRDYPSALAKSEFRMGEAFDPNDYPSAEELWDKFYVKLEIDPIPQAQDFRVGVSKQEAAAIQAQIEDRLRTRVQDAARSVWGRLKDVVEHYAQTMATADKTFKEATVRNLHELVEALPALNILEDPTLDQFAKEVRQSLNWTAREIRDDPETRKAAAEEASRVLDRLNGMMGAFSGMQEAA